jgi:cell division septal protein FtsQ
MPERKSVSGKVRLKDRRRRESYLVYALIGVVFVLVLGAVAYLTRVPSVTVIQVRVEGARVANQDAIAAASQAVLNGTYGLLVPKRMAFVVPEGAVAARIAEAFPAVQSADVSVEGRTTLVVRITERTPAALWCERPESCFVMDEYGFIFDARKAENAPGLAVYTGGTSGGTLASTYLSGEFKDFAALIKTIETTARRTMHRVAVDRNGDVVATFKEGGELRFTRRADAARLIADVQSVFDSEPFRNQKPLLYVDLRFPGKAVAKFTE